MSVNAVIPGPAVDEEGLAVFADTLAAVVREQDDSGSLWQTLSRDLALGGALIEERHGGLGGGAAETWIIMEALGRAREWTPYFSSVILAGGVLRRMGGAVAGRLSPGLISGELTLALAYLEEGRRAATAPRLVTARAVDGGWCVTGRKTMVLGLADADEIVATAAIADAAPLFFLVGRDTPGVTAQCYLTIDGKRGGDLDLADVFVPDEDVIGRDAAAFAAALDDATAALCAVGCGLMRELIARTIAYCRERRQFGRRLIDFQVLQHRLVDMHLAAEQAASLIQVALAKLDGGAEERTQAVAGAKILTGSACRTVAQGAIQLHGGIGTTDELPIGVFFRRALMVEHGLGDVAYQLSRYHASKI